MWIRIRIRNTGYGSTYLYCKCFERPTANANVAIVRSSNTKEIKSIAPTFLRIAKAVDMTSISFEVYCMDQASPRPRVQT
jgi:hypothetical protein